MAVILQITIWCYSKSINEYSSIDALHAPRITPSLNIRSFREGNMRKFLFYLKHGFWLFSFCLYSALSWAQDTTGIDGVDDMVKSGQDILKVGAKWGGIATVVGAALALGSGRLEGALAQTICKVLIVIGLLVAAMTFFGNKISWGFSF